MLGEPFELIGHLLRAEQGPRDIKVPRLDVVSEDTPAGDLIFSADVLEHFAPRRFERVIKKLVKAYPHQHHVIACYGEGRTRLIILLPFGQLSLFRKFCDSIQRVALIFRRNDPNQVVGMVSNTQS
jgi:hypothetical protein